MQMSHDSDKDKLASVVEVAQAASATNKMMKAISEEGQALTPESIQQINKASLELNRPKSGTTLKHGWGLVRNSLKSKSLFSTDAQAQRREFAQSQKEAALLDADLNRLEGARA